MKRGARGWVRAALAAISVIEGDTVVMQRPLRIMLVEDDDAQARIVALALETAQENCELRRVSDGDAAIDAMRGVLGAGGAQLPDLVLLDLKMPRRNGFEVLDEVKTDPLLRTIPIVVLSTSRAEKDRVGAYERHANSYLTKPADFDEFVHLLHDMAVYWAKWNEPPMDDR